MNSAVAAQSSIAGGFANIKRRLASLGRRQSRTINEVANTVSWALAAPWSQQVSTSYELEFRTVAQHALMSAFVERLRDVPGFVELMYKDDEDRWLKLVVIVSNDSLDTLSNIAAVEVDLAKTHAAKIDVSVLPEEMRSDNSLREYRRP